MKRRICFAGFGAQEVRGLEPALKEFKNSWDWVFCSDGAQTLECLASGPCVALVVDLRLTGMSSAELLHHTAASFPETLRFVLGSVDDRELMVNSIGAPFQFISKPWKVYDLFSVIERSLGLEAWLSSDKIRAFIPQLGRLPSLPATYYEILKRAESPNASVESIGELVARDPALTARLLQTVNSAVSGVGQKLTSPVEAVSVLGLETVKALVLCLQVFNDASSGGKGVISLEAFWQHSFAVGQLARKITELVAGDAAMAGHAFTAGLLHRIGQIILATNLAPRYGPIVEAARSLGNPLSEIESAQLGVTSPQIGAYLLGLWGLPLPIVEAAALFQAPSASSDGEFSLLGAVHVADVLVSEEHEFLAGLVQPRLDCAFLERLKLPTNIEAWRKLLGGSGRGQNLSVQPVEPEPQASETEDDKPRQEIKAAESGTAFRGKALAFALVIFVAAVVTSGGYKKFMGRNPGGGFIGLSTAPATQDKAPALSHLAEGALDSKTPAPSEGIDSLKLEGIFYRAGGSAALINGRSYVAGEQIKGMSIIAIERTNVVVEVGGQRQTLKLSSRKH